MFKINQFCPRLCPRRYLLVLRLSLRVCGSLCNYCTFTFLGTKSQYCGSKSQYSVHFQGKGIKCGFAPFTLYAKITVKQVKQFQKKVANKFSQSLENGIFSGKKVSCLQCHISVKSVSMKKLCFLLLHYFPINTRCKKNTHCLNWDFYTHHTE